MIVRLVKKGSKLVRMVFLLILKVILFIIRKATKIATKILDLNMMQTQDTLTWQIDEESRNSQVLCLNIADSKRRMGDTINVITPLWIDLTKLIKRENPAFMETMLNSLLQYSPSMILSWYELTTRISRQNIRLKDFERLIKKHALVRSLPIMKCTLASRLYRNDHIGVKIRSVTNFVQSINCLFSRVASEALKSTIKEILEKTKIMSQSSTIQQAENTRSDEYSTTRITVISVNIESLLISISRPQAVDMIYIEDSGEAIVIKNFDKHNLPLYAYKDDIMEYIAAVSTQDTLDQRVTILLANFSVIMDDLNDNNLREVIIQE